MTFLRTFSSLMIVVLLSGLAAAALPAVSVIEDLHAKLLETMKQADQLGIDGRFKQLQPVLEQSFDFERMIAATAGSYWTSGSDAERQRLLDAFTQLSITTYAARFNAYSGETFETLGQREGPRETVLVDTRLNRVGDTPVAITYVMAQRDGNWRIVDVLLDRSISELAVRRSEYNQVLRAGGLDKLTATLKQKAVELRGK